MKESKTYGRLLLAVFALGTSAFGCSHAQTDLRPAPAVVVDRTSADQTVVTVNGNGACTAVNDSNTNSSSSRKPASVTLDNKTYYFNSNEERDRFTWAHDINSRY
jgi:hypothetical protein